jgi:hypothetical protein
MVSMDLKTLFIGEEQERYGRCRWIEFQVLGSKRKNERNGRLGRVLVAVLLSEMGDNFGFRLTGWVFNIYTPLFLEILGSFCLVRFNGFSFWNRNQTKPSGFYGF